MTTIFADKKTLIQEYKRLFIANLSDLKTCLRNRYDKEEVSDLTLKELVKNNHKIIYDFVGSSNENRIKNFFGSPNFKDSRDLQISVIDKLILDCVHMEIMAQLSIRLRGEYPTNAVAIDAAWCEETKKYKDLGPIEPALIIQSIIIGSKELFFRDLKFPINQYVVLFLFKDNLVLLNPEFFKEWIGLQPLVINDEEPINLLLLVPFLLVLIISGTVAGLYLGLFASAIVVGVLSVFAGIGCLAYESGTEQEESVADTIIPSHILMSKQMPVKQDFSSAHEETAIYKRKEPLLHNIDKPVIESSSQTLVASEKKRLAY